MRAVTRLAALAILAGTAAVFPAHAAERAKPAPLRCDSSIAAAFKPNAETRVLLVRAFKKGDALPNASVAELALGLPLPMAGADLCLVKLLVGPGHPGPAGAPSTSAGIGIEVWLPSKAVWNGRVHALGGGGWVGGEETDLTKISAMTAAVDARTAARVAGEEGAVTATTDTGHTGGVMNGSFAMNPDGTINKTLWNDFASRGIHQQVVMAKALAKAYYGAPAKFTYWDGGSSGGRQALKQAQSFPRDFDGIISGYPAINWSRFGTAGLYPQIVIARDLGGKYMSADQLNLVSNAAIDACDMVDGKHLGFILDDATCHYDATRDPGVLCVSDGGRNTTPACVTPKQALAINKIWYGMTSDGSVPDPAVDNGAGPLVGKHRWYGMARGTNLLALASNPAFPIVADGVALELQDPRLASSSFRNATANGADGWKALSYAQLSQAIDAGVALQDKWGFINTDDPDLSAFKARGGKLMLVHGANDELIPYRGSVDYYQRVLARMGGVSAVRSFFRLFVVPGMGHGPVNGTTNPTANPPIEAPLKGEIYNLLTAWVEKDTPPNNVILKSANPGLDAKSLPMCAYPAKATFVGGDTHTASSYACR